MTNLGFQKCELGAFASATLLLDCALQLAALSPEPVSLAYAQLARADLHLALGKTTEARRMLDAIAKPKGDAWHFKHVRGNFLATSINCARLGGWMTPDLAAQVLAEVCDTRVKRSELMVLWSRALWHRDCGDLVTARDEFNEALTLAAQIRAPEHAALLAGRGRVVLALGEPAASLRPLVTELDRSAAPPHVELAALCLELGEHETAIRHALEAYRKAWGEGTPWNHHWDLEESRRILRALGEAEPSLPAYDPARRAPVPFDAELQARLAELRAEKAERDKRRSPPQP